MSPLRGDGVRDRELGVIAVRAEVDLLVQIENDLHRVGARSGHCPGQV